MLYSLLTAVVMIIALAMILRGILGRLTHLLVRAGMLAVVAIAILAAMGFIH